MEDVVTWFVTVFGYGMTLYLIKRWINKIDIKLDRYEEKRQECRESVPLRFADRRENDEEHENFSAVIGALERETAYSKGIRNGGGK